MIPKRFEDIDFSDIQALLNNQVTEGKTIEYKQEIPTNASSDKDPFLAGVSAFANTIGGDFIIGIEAKDGIPVNLSGANFTNVDAEMLRLEQTLQNGLEPRLPSVDIKDIESPTGEKFILVRVNRSWIAPHKVKANEKFYGRNSKGKYPLDVSELRTAFMLSEQLTERIKNFRTERIKKIESQDEMPIDLAEGGKLILHLFPLSAFTTSFEFDLQEFYESSKTILPLGAGASNAFINLDGVFSYSNNSSGKCVAYSQLFRNGCIEAAHIFEPRRDERKLLPSTYCEEILMNAVMNYRKLLSNIGIETPMTVFVTLLDVKEYELGIGSDFLGFEKRRLDRTKLFFPEQIIFGQESDSVKVLRPIFDKMWNSFGFLRSLNFDENDNWKGR